jgi:monoamine oxidase
VVRIEQDGSGVQAFYLQGGTRKSLRGDYLVCTIPFSVLKDLEVSPPFSREKRRAIEQLPYASVSRVYLQLARRFWLKENVSAEALTDGPLGTVEDHTFNQPGPRGILEAHTANRLARRIMDMKEEERIRFTREEIEKIYPEASENLEIALCKCWDEDEYSRGAYVYFKPGQMLALLPHIPRPEGRIFFAGEHTSRWFASMEGALESGVRAASEVMNASREELVAVS